MARRKPTSQHMEVPETGYGGLVSDILGPSWSRPGIRRPVQSTVSRWRPTGRSADASSNSSRRGGRVPSADGEGLLKRLADDLAANMGAGSRALAISDRSGASLSFYLGWQICLMLSGIPRCGHPSQSPKTSRLREFHLEVSKSWGVVRDARALGIPDGVRQICQPR